MKDTPLVQKVANSTPIPAGFDILTLASIIATVAGYLIDCYRNSKKEQETPQEIVKAAYFEGEYRPRLVASVARRIAIAERKEGRRMGREERRALAVRVLDAIREGDSASVDEALKARNA